MINAPTVGFLGRRGDLGMTRNVVACAMCYALFTPSSFSNCCLRSFNVEAQLPDIKAQAPG